MFKNWPSNLGAYNKFFVAAGAFVVFIGNQFFHYNAQPTVDAIIAFVSAIGVLLVENKKEEN